MKRNPLRLAALLGILLGSVFTACENITVNTPPAPEPRQDDSMEGSARWAFELARERAAAEGFDPDNELYVISGVTIGADGRLAANRGSWTFTFWNETNEEELEIQVLYDGEMEFETRSFVGDAPADRQPLPSDWADSTVVFQAAPSFSRQFVEGAVTNFDEWPADPGGAYWIIGCILTQECPHYYVGWDGVYLGDDWP